MRITTLGPLAVDGKPVGGKRLAAVVRELVEARGHAVSAATLVDVVWQGDPPEDAAGAVQALISRVRRLGVPVVAVPGGYRAPADQVETDVVAARTLIDRSRAALRDGDPAGARQAADEARALFPEVPDLTGAPAARLFAEITAARAECTLFGAAAATDTEAQANAAAATDTEGPSTTAAATDTEAPANAAAATDAKAPANAAAATDAKAPANAAAPTGAGAPTGLKAPAGAGPSVADDLRRLVARTPPDEPAAALLVRLLAAQGRDAEALEVVERLRAELADRYGTDPSQVITDVHVALLRGELAVVRPRRNARSVMPASWRRPGTALVGRERDLAAVVAGLAEAPLVTVVATGGAGKTRLAAEVARRATGAVRVIELAGLRTPEEVAPAVLSALGGAETTTERRLLSPQNRLRAAAAELDGLVVLDNCEHVLDAAATVVADLLAAAPDVAVLATSRAPLGLAGELVHRLATLPDAEALALLEARARAGGAMPTWDTERALRLCHRLDNLPLALELAAARLRHMPIDDVLAGLTDRFALLDDALRGLPERHASLWAMVDWSRELLADGERDLLQRLAVIPAPFTAAAAASVAGQADVRLGLAALVEQSLLVIEADGGPPRYRMLETVREYGEARLDDRRPAMTGLVSWARRLAVDLSGALHGPRQLETLGTVAREQENLVAALRWTLATGDEPAAVDLAAALFYPAMIRGLHVEVTAWAAALLHPDDPAARRRSVLLRGEGADADRLTLVSLLIAVNTGITGPLRLSVLATRALQAVRRNRAAEISPRYSGLAAVLPLLRDFRSAGARAAVEQLVAHDDPYVRAFGLFARSALRANTDGIGWAGDAEEAYSCFEVAGDHWGMGMAAQGLGNSAAARAAGTSVEWLTRSVRHMELIGAAQEARSVQVLLDGQLALAGDADAERRLHASAETDQAQDWDQARASLGLANLAWQRRDWATVLRRAAEIALTAQDHADPQPQHRVLFRVAAAVLHLAVAAEQPEQPQQPAPRADATATSLLAQARDEVDAGFDIPLLGAWAVAGALLARHRGDQAVARELWALGTRTDADLATLFPAAEFARLTAPLASEEHRPVSGPDATARIRQLMAELIGRRSPPA